MPRKNSTTWSVADPITALRLNDINEDFDDLYANWDDRGRVVEAASATPLKVDIGAFNYRVWSTEGQHAGTTDFTVTDDATNYIEIDSAGTISKNTTGWDGEKAKLATVTAASGVITAINVFKVDLVGGVTGLPPETFTAGEDITAGNAVCIPSDNIIANTSSNDTTIIWYNTSAYETGQSFLNTKWGDLKSLTFWVSKAGSSNLVFNLEIYSDTGTTLLGTSSNNLDTSTLTTSSEDFTFNFSGITLSANTTYYFKFNYVSGTVSTSNYWKVDKNNVEAYSGGVMYDINNSNTWTSTVTQDLKFSAVIELTGIFKTDGTNDALKNFIGFANETVTSGNTFGVNVVWVDGNQSGLTPGAEYYLAGGATITQADKSTNRRFWYAASAYDEKHGQEFLSTAAGNALDFTVSIRKFWSPTDNVVAKLYASNKTTLIATSDNSISGSSLTTSFSEETFNFTGITLADATDYFISIERDGAVNTSNYYLIELEVDATDRYTDGAVYTWNGSSWTIYISGSDYIDFPFTAVIKNIGGITDTPTTNSVKVGKATTASKILIYPGSRDPGEWKLVETVEYSSELTKTFNVTGGANKTFRLEYDLHMVTSASNGELRVRLNGDTTTNYAQRTFISTASGTDSYFKIDTNNSTDRYIKGYMDIGGSAALYGSRGYIWIENHLFSTYAENNGLFKGEFDQSGSFDLSSVELYSLKPLTGTVKIFEKTFN